MTKTALILEGGSLRCLYTAAVLDVLIKEGLEFDYVNGVSAGSLCGLNYESKQVGRTADVNINYVNDTRYLGVGNILSHGSIFNFDFLFHDVSEGTKPFDFEKYNNSKTKYEVVATDIESGKEVYFDGHEEDLEKICRASCSIPVVSVPVEYKGHKYLDGGIAMPIAYQRALDLGYDKVVIVLTRNKGYKKSKNGKTFTKAYEMAYRDYPALTQLLDRVPDHYNEMQVEMDTLEKEGKVFIVRPSSPVKVSRVEKNKQKLKDLYLMGLEDMKEAYPKLLQYLKGE